MNDRDYVDEVAYRLKQLTFTFMYMVMSFILTWVLLALSPQIPYGKIIFYVAVAVTGGLIMLLGRAIFRVNDILLL